MSLRQQISAGFARLAGLIKQNTTGISANTSAIGVLGNLATNAKSNLVSAINENAGNISALSSGALRATNFASGDFQPTDRPTLTETDPMIGPVLYADAGSLCVANVNVPLRSANVQAGDILRLHVAEVQPGSPAGVRIRRIDQVLTAGQSSADFAGPFNIPSGHMYAFMVGIASTYTGARDPASNRFYNGRVPLSAPNSTTAFAYEGSSDYEYAGVYGSNLSRIVLLTGSTAAKTIAGPIDFYDFPTIANTEGLPRSSVALFDNGTSRYLVKRLVDGSLRYGTVMTTTNPTYGVPVAGNTKQVLGKYGAANGAIAWMDAYMGNATSNTVSIKVVTNDQAYTSSVLTSNGNWRGAAILERVQVTNETVTGKIRIRIYNTDAAASADWSRAYGAAATGSNAPLLEYVFDSTSLRDIMPGAFFSLVSANNPTGGNIYWTVDQPGGATRATTANVLTMTFRMVG